jgi:hypothetical protein
MGTVASKREFASFKEFYPYYLQEHKNKVCRRLHFFGSWLWQFCLPLFINSNIAG